LQKNLCAILSKSIPNLLLGHLKRCLAVPQTCFKGDPAFDLGAVRIESLNTYVAGVTPASGIREVTSLGQHNALQGGFNLSPD
jgi:hypothetical protein